MDDKKIVGMSGTRKDDNEMALVIVKKKGRDLNCGTDSGKVRTTLTLWRSGDEGGIVVVWWRRKGFNEILHVEKEEKN